MFHIRVECLRISRVRKSSQKLSLPVRFDVTGDDVGPGPRSHEMQRQLEEMDRHRRTVQQMSSRIIELHTKVCLTLYNTRRYCMLSKGVSRIFHWGVEGRERGFLGRGSNPLPTSYGL